MPRQLKSAAEIRQEVSRLIHEVREVKEDRAKIGVPVPTPLREPDSNGCNWTMEIFGNANGYQDAVAVCVAKVRAVLNLRA